MDNRSRDIPRLQMAVSSAAAAGAEAVQGALSILVSVVNVVVIAPLANVW